MSQSASEARTSHRRCRHCARQRPGSCRQGPDRPPAPPPSPPPVSRSGSSNTRLAPCLVIRLRLDLARGPGLSDRCGACYGTRHVTRAALPKRQRNKLCSRRPAYRGRGTIDSAIRNPASRLAPSRILLGLDSRPHSDRYRNWDVQRHNRKSIIHNPATANSPPALLCGQQWIHASKCHARHCIHPEIVECCRFQK